MGVSTVARKTAKEGQGMRFQSGTASIRVMRGNPKSPNPAQQNPCVKIVDKNGNVYGADGKIIQKTDQVPRPSQAPEAHIPLKDFDPDKFKF
jgi:hypothetical protein